MEDIISFISLLFILVGLGIDNGLLVEFSVSSLKISSKAHFLTRTIILLLSAGIRIIMIFFLAEIQFLAKPLPHSSWFVNNIFAHSEVKLTYMNFILFLGGIVIICMAIWEYYHKLREELDRANQKRHINKGNSLAKITILFFYLLLMNVLFSLDSVFTAVAIMDIKKHFFEMVLAIFLASIIMIFAMVPIGRFAAKNKHFSVLMLSVLVVIASKLLVDGVGGHFSNGLLLFIIGMLFLNDIAQGLIDYVSAKNVHRT